MLLKKPLDEKVSVEVDLALKAVIANKRMAGTVAARAHLVLIKVLAEEAEVLVEITTVQVLHVVSVVEEVGDLAKAAALGKILTKRKMVLEVEGLVQKVVVGLEAVEGLAVAAAVVAAALVRVVVVLEEVGVVLEEVGVVFQVVMMGKMVVAEVVVLVAAVVELVIVVVRRGT